jgi:hypothetical protein
MGEIKKAINNLIGIEDMVYFNDCEVISNNQNERTCIVQNGVNEIVVRLMSVVDDGILIMPKIGSIVSVLQSDKYDPIIVQFSEVDKIILMGGDNKGLVKVIELKNKLNAVENQLNNILNVLKSTSIPLAPSGTYPFAPLYTSINTLTPTQQADIENPLITH